MVCGKRRRQAAAAACQHSSSSGLLQCSPWATIRALCWVWGAHIPSHPSLQHRPHRRQLSMQRASLQCWSSRRRRLRRRSSKRAGRAGLPRPPKLPSCPARPHPSRNPQPLPLRPPQQSPPPPSLPSATGTFPLLELQAQDAGGAAKQRIHRRAALQQPRPRWGPAGCPLSRRPPALLCRAGALPPKHSRRLHRCAISCSITQYLAL